MDVQQCKKYLGLAPFLYGIALGIALGVLGSYWYFIKHKKYIEKKNCKCPVCPKPAEEKDRRIQAKYLLMDPGVLNCPVNYARIYDESQCAAATLSFGLRIPNHLDDSRRSTGCITTMDRILTAKGERGDGGTILNFVNKHTKTMSPRDADSVTSQTQRIFCQRVA